jgi:DNA-binding transcriptional LysR family regulator
MQHFSRERLAWDDLQLILAVARRGSFAKAAEALGVSSPTVFRRAKALETSLGTLIFQRDNTGVSLTAAGREAAETAARIGEEVQALEASIANANSNLAGMVRLATVDTLVAGPLMPIVARFRRQHPSILLDLQSGVRMADLRQREVDASLRAGGEPSAELIGRRLCRIAVAIYRSRDFGPHADTSPDACPWIVPDRELDHLASAKWLRDRGGLHRASLRVNSLHSLALAVECGMGLGILPCYLADPNPHLIRIGEPIAALSSDLWFLTHAEQRHSARIRKLSDFLFREFRTLRPLFDGSIAAA